MATMMRTQNKKQEQWNSVFPEFATLEGSCLFIKKLIAVSLSSITYMRGIFPERAYGDKDLYGVKLKILDESCGLKSVNKFIGLVRNCYEAVENKYLQQMSIGIVPNPENREEVVELYNLVFHYKDEYSISCRNKKSEISSKHEEAVKQATILMLKNVYTISNMLESLPPKSYITMKLFYYDDVTPPDYEPKGFSPCHKSTFEFTGETVKVMLGKIDTNNHGYKFNLKTTLGGSLPSLQSENNFLKNSQSSNIEEASNAEESMKGSQTTVSRKVASNNISSLELQCPCKCKTEDLSDTIICVGCDTRHHKVCYAILKPENIPSTFYCIDCIVYNTDETSNQDLIYKYSDEDRQKLCIMRRALCLCVLLKTVGSSILEKKLGCTKAEASKLIERLEDEGFIKKCGRKYSVDIAYINEYGFDSYFPTAEKENINTEGFQKEESQEMDCNINYNGSENRFSNPNSDATKLYDENIIESSIRKVHSLSLSSLEGESKSKGTLNNSFMDNTNRSSKSQKRKLSTIKQLMSPDNSEDIFHNVPLKTKKIKTRGTR